MNCGEKTKLRRVEAHVRTQSVSAATVFPDADGNKMPREPGGCGADKFDRQSQDQPGKLHVYYKADYRRTGKPQQKGGGAIGRASRAPLEAWGRRLLAVLRHRPSGRCGLL